MPQEKSGNFAKVSAERMREPPKIRTSRVNLDTRQHFFKLTHLSMRLTHQHFLVPNAVAVSRQNALLLLVSKL